MVPFNYSELRLGPKTTRLVRLLPSEKDETPIRCELITYVLPESTGRKHLYEALSYVWGSQIETPLVHLRDHQLERILWIDAICINQEDADEKSEQIPLMRSIYAQAARVIVWLGEAMRDGDEALMIIQRWAAASSPSDDSLLDDCLSDPCSRLLRRDWFQRAWILQEVGVARCISILCGSVEINGHVFCEGLENCLLSLPSFIYPILHLIKGSYLRPRFEIDSCGTLAIGELLDMYRFHKATMLHDKIYSLLGLCVEDPDEVGLKPNYRLPWNEVFMQAIMHVFPSSCSVETWPESPVAVIKGKGLVLGYVGFAQKHILKNGSQQIEVNYNDTAHSLGYQGKWGTEWRLRVSAESVEQGDIIFLLKGASSPIIIRPCSGYFTVVVSTTALQSHDDMEWSNGVSTPKDFLTQSSLNDIVLVWDISSSDGEKNKEHDDQNDLIYLVPRYQEKAVEKKKRLQAISLISEGIMTQILQQNGSEKGDTALLMLHLRIGRGLPDLKELIKAAAADRRLDEIMMVEQLLKHGRDSLPVSKSVVAAAAANEELLGFIALERLQKYCGKCLPVTEDVVKAAAANEGFFGYGIIKRLLQHCGESIPVSEELLEHCGRGSIIVSKDVIKAATANKRNFWDETVQQRLEDFATSLLDFDDVIDAVAANEEVGQELLLAYGKPEPTRI
ncbi:HET domain-containing protein [Aspergillus vadensis CBS 113365]|uniref:HET domain protein n=1 Tax=Aspergillus vadensis (strain CBS 113365 / IMI 142717 / IBT 24658) TaxID=1448311 RepID=A0A319BAC6_ASPVC|nr:HET domain protein [Aspergillus vadensis CBS 113365]PYH68901.1 HET domain protein [Aspergillus vadensis CBS 113365]